LNQELTLLSLQQITPAFVKEAYALLSQSIIHVEKDDVEIDSDSDDDDDEAPAATGDAPATSQTGPGASSPSRRPDAIAEDDEEEDSAPTPKATTPVPQAPKKPKVSITYDKYMLIMQKVVYMLADVERETNAGLPRSEVVQRYLEDLEGEMTGIEQLEAETVLIEKVLTKLVKVSFALVPRRLSLSLTSRTFAGEVPSRASWFGTR
jgi:DNA replication licensing factor MCM6